MLVRIIQLLRSSDDRESKEKLVFCYSSFIIAQIAMFISTKNICVGRVMRGLGSHKENEKKRWTGSAERRRKKMTGCAEILRVSHLFAKKKVVFIQARGQHELRENSLVT